MKTDTFSSISFKHTKRAIFIKKNEGPDILKTGTFMPAILTELSESSLEKLTRLQIRPVDAVSFGLILGHPECSGEDTPETDIFFRMEIGFELWSILKEESAVLNLGIGKTSGLFIERFLEMSEGNILCRFNLHR